MFPPVRCFTCGKPLGGRIWKEFRRRVEAGENPEKVFEALGITRYCCRTVLLTSVDLFDEISGYTAVRTK